MSVSSTPRSLRARAGAIAHLAWPSVLAGWLKVSFAAADTWSAGALSTDALAALSAGTLFAWVLASLSMTNSLGFMSRLAQAVGAAAAGEGGPGAVRTQFGHALWGAAVLGALCGAIMWAAAAPTVAFMDLPRGVRGHALTYMHTLALGAPAFWLFDTAEQAFRARGDARTPFAVTAGFAVLNLGLNPLLAFGVGPVAGLGMRGIAIATVLAWTGGAAALLWRASTRGWLNRTPHAAAAGRGASWLAAWRIGAPSAAAGVLFDAVYVVLTPKLSAGGPAFLAAVSIGHRLESVAYLANVGIGMAVTTLVGQALGRRDVTAARAYAQTGMWLGFVCTAGWVLVLWALGPRGFALFTPDRAVHGFGVVYLGLVAVYLPLQSVEQAVSAAFAGAGRTLWPMVINIAVYGARVPLSAWLFERYGAIAVLLAVGWTAGMSGVAMLGRYLRVPLVARGLDAQPEDSHDHPRRRDRTEQPRV